MRQIKLFESNERGATLVEFAIAATVFLTAMFAVIEFGRGLWVHNALSDAARRGARYAVLHSAGDIDEVKNVVVYGNPEGGSQPTVPNLTPDNVTVTYSHFALNKGRSRSALPITNSNLSFQSLAPRSRCPVTPRRLQVKALVLFRTICRRGSQMTSRVGFKTCQSQVSNPLPGGTITTPAFRTSLRTKPALQHLRWSYRNPQALCQ